MKANELYIDCIQNKKIEYIHQIINDIELFIISKSIRILTASVLGIAFLLSGCALHYYDRATGTDHLWGIGHLSMQTQTEQNKKIALIRGLETVGFVTGIGQDDSYFQTGWSRQQRLELLQPDAAIQIKKLSADFMTFKIEEYSFPAHSSDTRKKP
jgi:hypothetical protein